MSFHFWVDYPFKLIKRLDKKYVQYVTFTLKRFKFCIKDQERCVTLNETWVEQTQASWEPEHGLCVFMAKEDIHGEDDFDLRGA